MVYTATKSDKTVLEDGLKEDSGKRKMMEKIACGIDNVSRVLFPLAFVAYNIFLLDLLLERFDCCNRFARVRRVPFLSTLKQTNKQTDKNELRSHF